MEWEKGMLEKISDYDFLLVDSNFFSSVDAYSDNNLIRRLYDTKFALELNQFEEELKKLYHSLQWKFKDIVKNDRVFTIPEVGDELLELDDIFFKSYKYHDKNTELIQKGRNAFKGHASSIKDKVRLRRANQNIEKFLKPIRKKEIEPYKENKALRYLYYIFEDIQETVECLNIYTGLIKEYPHEVNGASKTDYRLVGAAIGYSLENPSKKLGIISCDKHIEQIAFSSPLNRVFDIITPSQIIKRQWYRFKISRFDFSID